MTEIVLGLIIIFLGLLSLPFTVFSSWLLYQQVHATQLMWFLWWINIPILILVTAFTAILKGVSKK